MINYLACRSPWYRSIAVFAVAVLLGGCASAPKSVPFAVQSDPLGAHVLFKPTAADGSDDDGGDWVYLGATPVDLRRELGRSLFKRDDAFTLRVLKDGYLEQRKTWAGEDIKEQIKTIGKVFWNPRLVPSGQ